MRAGRSNRIGVDIGGTFTDLVLIDAEGRLFHNKTASTPAAPEQAVLDGIRAIIAQTDLDFADIDEIVHGTTVGSNTLLQKVGARTGLITTRGFRDVLEIGRLRTPGMFDLQWSKPEPLVARRHRLEVTERIAFDGSIILPLDEDELVTVTRDLVDEGIESIALCFLNSYRNPVHEQRAGQVLSEAFPDLRVTTSVSVLPEAKEYERTSTTVVNAYVAPVLGKYLTRLEEGIAGLGINAPLLVGNSNGALASSETARSKPVFFISSGRAAGVVGGGRLGQALDLPDLVVFDMGGTTASASLVQNGELSRVSEYEFRAGISTPSRFIKAGGYMMSVPTVDVAEVGSGAGSIAHLDSAGLIKVGPISAGADPGPVCYDMGGTRPTVTDANLVLGYLPASIAGGARQLSVDKAREAIAGTLGEALQLDAVEAAFGVREVTNANMARAIRAVTVERGVDPRDFTLAAIGGSGPVHAASIAELLSIKRLLIPASPGVFTAMGMLAGDVERYYIAPFAGELETLDATALRELTGRLRQQATETLRAEGIADDCIECITEINLHFRGQEMTLAVPFDEPFDPAVVRGQFLDMYQSIYSYSSSDSIEAVSIRLTGRGLLPGKLDFRKISADRPEVAEPKSRRDVYFGRDSGWVSTPVYARPTAPRSLEGPAILEAADSTVVIPPAATARLDPQLNLHIELA
ncbi:hydantoinase/oxoprolinase family protein [Pseudohoeflea coraliihabitans]|uniref:Hydantoinase/oxoprolinase family protein n=1 Tax=Pseudohoeflea coraliihabitans TaxID=2860393 RepID=A0ABS6WM61_9HYPH|nr:hydantoinase/oxoprolinase family protein [Pseudohoeflea sp. DP4N28-3]MBW3097043.1 hydantoinase/oxoprolinase family protein [Pseudohoeflea sp. DP4N28-3]